MPASTSSVKVVAYRSAQSSMPWSMSTKPTSRRTIHARTPTTIPAITIPISATVSARPVAVAGSIRARRNRRGASWLRSFPMVAVAPRAGSPCGQRRISAKAPTPAATLTSTTSSRTTPRPPSDDRLREVSPVPLRGKHQSMEGTPIFEARPGVSQRLARRLRNHRPITAGAAVTVAGYLVLTALLVGIGFLLTELLLDGPIGRWDDSINVWFVRHRTPTFDELTIWGSRLGDTVTVIGIATLAVGILAIARHWAQIAFLVGALVIEVTTVVA